MNLFDKLVDEALKDQPQLASLQLVVEKELLHHDILRILSEHHFLKHLTFIGGTCLRYCYDGERLSEDLDFTGGKNFDRNTFSMMSEKLITGLKEKYGLEVEVSDPQKEEGNVDTWKLKVITRPEKKDLPAQRIHIDICSIASYDARAVMIVNPYRVDMGTRGLVVQAQSREEIYTDKLLAFAFRPNRIKYRDVWDILWLYQLGFSPRFDLLTNKLEDRKHTPTVFFEKFDERVTLLKCNDHTLQEFINEMRRFLPVERIKKVLEQAGFLEAITYHLQDLSQKMRNHL